MNIVPVTSKSHCELILKECALSIGKLVLAHVTSKVSKDMKSHNLVKYLSRRQTFTRRLDGITDWHPNIFLFTSFSFQGCLLLAGYNNR